ncbi:hypothetical protein HN51_060389 [Arachis hypogaea]|nr:Syntaxin [Arachis hypogaea]
MVTIQEIQERHDSLIDIERSPNELHQLFLDMAVLVQSQGKQLNDRELRDERIRMSAVGPAVPVCKEAPEEYRKSTFIAFMILIIFILIIVQSPK